MKKMLLLVCMIFMLASCTQKKFDSPTYGDRARILISVFDKDGNDLLDTTKCFSKSIDFDKIIIDDGQKRELHIEGPDIWLQCPDVHYEHAVIFLWLNVRQNGVAETVIRWNDEWCDTLTGQFDDYACRERLWINGKEEPENSYEIVLIK